VKNFELIKAGQPSEIEILSENVMNNIIGGSKGICKGKYCEGGYYFSQR
jgi:hypothetical protein